MTCPTFSKVCEDLNNAVTQRRLVHKCVTDEHTFVTTHRSSVSCPRLGCYIWTLVCFHIRDEIRHRISDAPQSIPTALPGVDPQNRLQNLRSCMFHLLRSLPRHLDAVCALLEAQSVTEVTLAFVCVLHSPPGSHDSLSLWVSPAPCCQEGPNVNMLLHLHHLQCSTT